MSGKRTNPRFQVQLPARYKILSSPSVAFEATVVSIGAEGLCFQLKDLLDIGQVIELQVHLDLEEKVLLKTEIIWIQRRDEKTYRAGVKIVDVPLNEEIRFIKFYCGKMLSLFENCKKILVIDDERGLVKFLQKELEEENYKVVCAYDGEEGFAKYLSEQPDLIILDIRLPKLNGYEVCRKVRRERRDQRTPILMVTAASNDADKIIGSVVGAHKYMTKPFKIEDLLHAIDALLQPKRTDVFSRY